MRKKVNKCTKYLLAAAMFCTTMFYTGKATTVSAATYHEVEPNDVRSEATEIKAGNEYIGKISDKDPSKNYSGETDYYKYTVTQDGYCNFTFGKASINTETVKDGWVVSIYKDSNCIYTENVTTKTLTTPNFNYKKGTILYIVIEPKNTFINYCPTDIEYKLRVNSYQNQYWEQEDNDIKTQATVVKSNTMYYGNIMDKEERSSYINEVDYFKYQVEDNGYFTLSFEKKNQDDEDVKKGWLVEVYNSVDSYPMYSMKVGGEKAITPKFNLKKGSNVYIKVTSKDSYIDDSSAYIDYQFKVNFTKNSSWELENNDTQTTATAINLGKTYYGSILNKNESQYYIGEKDYYRYNVKEDGKYTLDFKKSSINLEKVEDGWSISIYNGNTLIQTINAKDKAVKSVQFNAKRGNQIYILVEPKNDFYMYCPINIEYTLKLNCVAKEYSIKYNLNGGKNNTQNPSKISSNAAVALKNPTRKGYTFDGWYIGNKKVTQIAKGTKANVTVTAKWKKVSVGTPAKLSTTSKKSKELYISYSKVSGAAGYEVSYCTNNKFKGGTVKKLLKADRLTINKLKSKQQYYVRVRAYKLDSTGNKVFGGYKTVKTVKVK